MRFRAYYELHSVNKKRFNETFERYYKKGYFGESIDKDELMKQYKGWYEKLLYYIKDKNLFELSMALASKENRFSRDMFSQITGIDDIRYKTKEEVLQIVEEYCNTSDDILETTIINNKNMSEEGNDNGL